MRYAYNPHHACKHGAPYRSLDVAVSFAVLFTVHMAVQLLARHLAVLTFKDVLPIDVCFNKLSYTQAGLQLACTKSTNNYELSGPHANCMNRYHRLNSDVLAPFTCSNTCMLAATPRLCVYICHKHVYARLLFSFNMDPHSHVSSSSFQYRILSS
jgi:hypothetical protein